MKSKLIKVVSVFLAINMLGEICFPTVAYALSGGPSQPEVQSFEPMGTTEMVDVFSGDFNYNIPLLDVEGYPINIAYHSGITMDQEASWVGLGWNINPGAITRGMRGLPDDFSGDVVTKEFYIKPNYTFGIDLGGALSPELFGVPLGNASLSKGVFYNNYRGIGISSSFTMSTAIGAGIGCMGVNVGGVYSVSNNTQEGTTISKGYSYGIAIFDNTKKTGAGYSYSNLESVNSRSGIKSVSRSHGFSVSLGFRPKGQSGGNRYTVGGAVTSINYSFQSYTPSIQIPQDNFSATARYSVGGAFYGLHPSCFINGYVSVQRMQKNSDDYKVHGYGYLYSEQSLSEEPELALLDVNREKDGAYTTNKPALPIANYTYDIYSIAGQGVAGMFRPHRGDLGVLADNKMETSKNMILTDGSYSAEVGLGALIHAGVDVTLTDASTETGKWSNGNNLGSSFGFLGRAPGNQNPLYEPSYFKVAGEKTPVLKDHLSYQNLDEVFSPLVDPLYGYTSSSKLRSSQYNPANANTVTFNATNLAKNTRDKRSQLVNYRTAGEGDYCVERNVVSYHRNDFSGSRDSVSRVSGYPAHHLSELSVVNTSGARYVYGIPAYNNKEEEYTFAIGGGGSLSTGLVSYDPAILSNKKGVEDDYKEGFYSATKLPRYAHSYLLTSVLSADYVDINQNGPDAKDLGGYTKINYTKVHSNYKWRVPYKKGVSGEALANYQSGDLSNPHDNMANMTYGEKEIWYMHSVETKNYVAEFRLVKREDGIGGAGVHGGIGADSSYRLETITLYTKAERAKGDNAVPIKTVHFEYDYSLCPDVENNSGLAVDKTGNPTVSGDNVNVKKGKLTLRKIYFTYGKSNKSRFSAYTFHYTSDDGIQYNKPYHIKGYDRWGNYKENDPVLVNAAFPYVEQDTGVANTNVQQWTLNRIELPSGGAIHVEYESDDYAYVQDRRAMQMFKIVGFSDSKSGTPSSDLYTGTTVNDYLFVRLTSPVATDAEFIREYLGEIEKLYFTCKVDMGSVGARYEYIRGYAELDGEIGGLVPGDASMGWIKLKQVGIEDTGGGANPISKATWQYARLNARALVYPESDMRQSLEGFVKGIRLLVGTVYDLSEAETNINQKLKAKNYGKTVNPAASWVRLNNPNKRKLGGGIRVKRLYMTDNWHYMSSASGDDSSYGQEYDYTTTETNNGTTRIISSGVASYEPIVGNDENPFRLPVTYDKKNYIIPDEQFYVEEPFGEMFFPGAQVGYSKVTVRNLRRTNVNKHATGKIIHEFYTAKDFPTITRRSEVQPRVKEANVLSVLFYSTVNSGATVTAGYMVEANDMHGKPKAMWNYAASDPDDPNGIERLVSGMQYFYKTDAGNASHLNNVATIVKPDRSLDSAIIGVDVDLFSDARREYSSSSSMGVCLNGDMFIVGIFPIAAVVPLPTIADNEMYFNSMTVTKFVQRYGLLERTIAYEEGATIATYNEAYDAETGEVILTRTENEYNDPVYNTSFPAYWVYDGMGPSYKNTNVVIEGITVIDNYGHFTMPSGLQVKDYFTKGDEVILSGYTKKLWIGDDISSDGSLAPFLLPRAEADGYPPMGTYTLKIIKSGRKNLLDADVLTATTLQKPVSSSKLTLNGASRVIHAQASEFSDAWRQQCVVFDTIINVYSGTEMQLQMFNIAKYLVSTQAHATKVGHDLCSGGVHFGPYDIITTYPGSTAYTESFLHAKRVAEESEHVFDETLLKDCGEAHPNQITYRIDFPYGTSGGGSIGGVYFQYQDTGCIHSSTLGRPVEIEYVSTTGMMSENLNQLNGSIQVRLKFDSTCSVVVPMWIDHMPIFADTLAVHKCKVKKPDVWNEFLAGTSGNWRKSKEVVYLEERITENTQTNIRKDGYYRTFVPYWDNSGASGKWTNPYSNLWVVPTTITNYEVTNGNVVETKDALDRYSAVLYQELGASNLAMAKATNAKINQVGYENFELYGYGSVDDYSGDCPTGHWNFFQSPSLYIDTTTYHTGKMSLRLAANGEAYTANGVYNVSSERDVAACRSCILPFYPDPGKYWISAWVKTNTNRTDVSNRKGQIEVTVGGVNGTVELHPSGPIIEGWQRIEGVVTIPPYTLDIKVVLKADPDLTTWFDDVRIQPANSNMSGYVYDNASHRLMSELDENNYAVFYEYDEQGALKRVKRETDKGIVTVKETRTSTFKR